MSGTEDSPATAPGPATRGFGRAYRAVAGAAITDRFNESARGSGVAVIATTLTPHPFVISAITASNFLPWLLFGLPSGLLLDRFQRRTVALITSLLRCVVALVVVAVVLAGWLNPFVLLVAVFALAALQVAADTAINAMLPDTVPAARLGEANGRMSSGQSTASVIGPPIGSSLSASYFSFPFVLSAGLGVVAAGLIRRVPVDTVRRTSPWQEQGIWSSVAAGLVSIRRSPRLTTLLGTVFISNLCNGALIAMLPLLVLRILDDSARDFGLIAAAQSCAVILGSLVGGRAMRTSGRAAVLMRVGLFAKLPAFVAVGLAPNGWVVLAAFVVLGLTSGIWNVASSSALLLLSAGETRARTLAAYKTISSVAAPIGALVAGACASAASPRAAIIGAGALTLCSASFFATRMRNRPMEQAADEEGGA